MDSYRRSSHRHNRSRTPPRPDSRQSGRRRDREVDEDQTNSSRRSGREGKSQHSTRSNSHYSPDRRHRSRSRSRHSREDQAKRKPHASRSDHYSPQKDKQSERTNERRKYETRRSSPERNTSVRNHDETKENRADARQENTSLRKKYERSRDTREEERASSRVTEKTTKNHIDSSEVDTKKSARECSYRSSIGSNGTNLERSGKSRNLEQTESSRNYRKRESSSTSTRYSSKKLKPSEQAERSKQAPNSTPSNDKSQIDKEHSNVRGGACSTKVDIYEKLEQVGEGTYGKVFKARNIATNTVVALKRIKVDSEKDGFPLTALREIKLLQSLSHQNIIQLPEISYHKGSLYMVFEYMDYDLTGFLAHPNLTLNASHIKRLMIQILRGIKYLHENDVLHRDLKASNLLLNKRGQLKLADFGLARAYDKCKSNQYTNRVITLWYRPPELLLGGTKYGPEVDMWSVGCIMMELYLRKPLFQGKDEISQLQLIYDLLGTPTPNTWPKILDLPWYRLIKPKEVKERRFEKDFRDILSPEAFDLVRSLLSMDPSKRPSADQALRHKYFTSELPNPCELKDFPKLEGDWHEYEAKEMRKKNQKHTSHDPLLRSTRDDTHSTKSRPAPTPKQSADPHQRPTHESKERSSHNRNNTANNTVSGSNRSPKATSHRRMVPERKEVS